MGGKMWDGYHQWYYQQNKEVIKARSREYYRNLTLTAEGRTKLKQRREKQHFGDGVREEVLKRDNYTCVRCDNPAQIVHHIDGDGRTREKLGKRPGTDQSRMEALCRRCHLEKHRSRIASVKRTRENGFWSRKFSSCICCKKTDSKHNSKGLCMRCVARAMARIRKKNPGKKQRDCSPEEIRQEAGV